MSVGDKEVLPAVIVVIEEVGAPPQEAQAGQAQSGGAAHVPESVASQVPVKGVVVRGEVGDVDVESSVPVVVAEGDPHAGLSLPVLVEGHGRHQSPFIEGSVSPIAEEKVGHGIVGHVEVAVAVAVVVAPDGAHPVGSRRVHAGRLGGFPEGAVAVAQVEGVPGCRKPTRPAVDLDPAVLAVGRCGRRIFVAEFHVVGHVEVQPSVAVRVGKGCAGTPGGIPHSRFPGHVPKGAVAVVPVQEIGTVVADVEVGPAVVVVVGDGHPHSPMAPSHARLAGHQPETPVPLVPIEGIGDAALPGSQLLPEAPVDGIQIEPAVPVVVDPTDSAAHRLQDVVLGAAPAPVPEVQPRFTAHLREVNAARDKKQQRRHHPCQSSKMSRLGRAWRGVRRGVVPGAHWERRLVGAPYTSPYCHSGESARKTRRSRRSHTHARHVRIETRWTWNGAGPACWLGR